MIPFGSIVMANVSVHLPSTLHPKCIRMIAVGSSLIHQGGIPLFNPLTNKFLTRRNFKQLGPVDVTSIIPDYTVDYEEVGIPLENALDVTSIPIIANVNIDDYRYLLHTTHTDDEDHRLYEIIKIDIPIRMGIL